MYHKGEIPCLASHEDELKQIEAIHKKRLKKEEQEKTDQLKQKELVK